MGFKKPSNTIKLTFTGEYEGLKVAVKTPSIKTALFMQSLEKMDDNEGVPAMVKSLAEHIVSWNVEDDNGKTIKATENELTNLPIDMFQAILEKWITSTVGVPAPLDNNSNSISAFQEDLIPMDVL